MKIIIPKEWYSNLSRIPDEFCAVDCDRLNRNYTQNYCDTKLYEAQFVTVIFCLLAILFIIMVRSDSQMAQMVRQFKEENTQLKIEVERLKVEKQDRIKDAQNYIDNCKLLKV